MNVGEEHPGVAEKLLHQTGHLWLWGEAISIGGLARCPRHQ